MSDGTHRELNWGIGRKQCKPRPYFDQQPCPVCKRPTSISATGFWPHYGTDPGKYCCGVGLKPSPKPVVVPDGTLTKLNTCLDVLRQISESKRGGLNKRLALSCLEFIDACDRELAMKI